MDFQIKKQGVEKIYKRELIEKGNNILEGAITMDKQLTLAAHGLLLSEKRLIMACIVQLDSRRQSSIRKRIKVTAKEFSETFGISMRTAYEQLKHAALKLFEREIRLTKKTRTGKAVVKFRWVGSVCYHDNEGFVELSFSTDVEPYLVGLHKNFTTYRLQQATSLRSIYACRLLEVLMTYEQTGWWKVSLEDFYMVMDVPDSYKTTFQNLKVIVIQQAIKELTRKGDWIIKWAASKKIGKKIMELKFTFKRDPQQRLALE